MLMYPENEFRQGSYIKIKQDREGQKYKVVHV